MFDNRAQSPASLRADPIFAAQYSTSMPPKYGRPPLLTVPRALRRRPHLWLGRPVRNRPPGRAIRPYGSGRNTALPSHPHPPHTERSAMRPVRPIAQTGHCRSRSTRGLAHSGLPSGGQSQHTPDGRYTLWARAPQRRSLHSTHRQTGHWPACSGHRH